MKNIVNLRVKKLANGQGSYYLDWFQYGKRYYEYLKIYIDLDPNASRQVQKENKEKERIAINARNKKENELLEGRLDVRVQKKADLSAEEYIKMCGTSKEHQHRAILHYKDYFGDMPLRAMTKEKLLAFRTHILEIRSAGTGQIVFGKICCALRRAMLDNVVPTNLLDNVPSITKERKPVTYLTTEDLKKMWDYEWYNPYAKRIFFFTCYTGLRFSDVRDLSWGKITDDYKIIFSQVKTQYDKQTGKATDYTCIPLSEKAIELMGERGADDEKVFPNMPDNNRMNYYLHKVAKRCGLDKDVHFHMARHTLGVQLLSNGVDIYSVSKLLGHRSVTTTSKYYADLTDDKAREAINKFPTIF